MSLVDDKIFKTFDLRVQRISEEMKAIKLGDDKRRHKMIVLMKNDKHVMNALEHVQKVLKAFNIDLVKDDSVISALNDMDLDLSVDKVHDLSGDR